MNPTLQPTVLAAATAASTAASDVDMPFEWARCYCPLTAMPGGAVITGQECDSDLTVTVQLQTPLLFWRERSRWMWHKKWTLPRIFVSVDVGAGVPLDRPLFAMILCGTVVAGD